MMRTAALAVLMTLVATVDAGAEEADPLLWLRTWPWATPASPSVPNAAPAGNSKAPVASSPASKPASRTQQAAPASAPAAQKGKEKRQDKRKPASAAHAGRTAVNRQADREPHAQQPASQVATCKPIAVNCLQVCEHAWMGETAGIALGVAWGYCRPTPTQQTQGKACVRKYCPQYLNK
jgi:hypothetical protein